MAEGCGEQRLCSGTAIECNDDPFANFSCNPPKPSGNLRNFIRKNRYRAMAGLSASRERLSSIHGSNSSLATLVGSSQNLLDPSRMMNMQEDAKSRRISSEIMKHRLYESVLTSPRRRRFSFRCDYYGASGDCTPGSFQGYARMVQSLPVTPAHSENVTPAHSPKSKKSFHYGFMSHGVTPTGATPEEEEMEVGEDDGSCRGLASIFQPQPRFVAASHNADNRTETSMSMDDVSWSSGFKHPGSLGLPPKRFRRERSPAAANKDVDTLSSPGFQ